MAVLAVLSYRHVKQQLYRQSESRLQQANRALGQAIFERLLLLDATQPNGFPRLLQGFRGPPVDKNWGIKLRLGRWMAAWLWVGSSSIGARGRQQQVIDSGPIWSLRARP
jgi:hypothetical protein